MFWMRTWKKASFPVDTGTHTLHDQYIYTCHILTNMHTHRGSIMSSLPHPHEIEYQYVYLCICTISPSSIHDTLGAAGIYIYALWIIKGTEKRKKNFFLNATNGTQTCHTVAVRPLCYADQCGSYNSKCVLIPEADIQRSRRLIKSFHNVFARFETHPTLAFAMYFPRVQDEYRWAVRTKTLGEHVTTKPITTELHEILCILGNW